MAAGHPGHPPGPPGAAVFRPSGQRKEPGRPAGCGRGGARRHPAGGGGRPRRRPVPGRGGKPGPGRGVRRHGGPQGCAGVVCGGGRIPQRFHQRDPGPDLSGSPGGGPAGDLPGGPLPERGGARRGQRLPVRRRRRDGRPHRRFAGGPRRTGRHEPPGQSLGPGISEENFARRAAALYREQILLHGAAPALERRAVWTA